MRYIRVMPKKFNTGALAGAVVFLFWAAVVLVLSFLVRPSGGSADIVTAGLLQEEIGERIQSLGRSDLDRHSRLQERWAKIVQRKGLLEHGRAARLQEALGQAIARTGHGILLEQAAIHSALNEASEQVQKFRTERPARQQEQLGKAVLWAVRHAPAGGDAFQSAFLRKANHFQAIDERVERRLESRLKTLATRQAEYPDAIPLLYEEAIQSTKRSARMLNDSEEAWINRNMGDLKERLTWIREPQDYIQIAGSVRELSFGLPRASEFQGYGLPALIGLALAMIWVSSITRKDQAEVRRPVSVKTAGLEKDATRGHWMKEVFAGYQTVALFSWPKEVVFGANVSHQIGRYALKDKKNKAMIIADEGVAQSGLLEPLRSSFHHAGLDYRVYGQVKREVPDTVISELLEYCRDEKIDLLVAVGGGSVIDTAKAVGILLTNGGRIQDYEGADKVLWGIPRLYVVPTTAGCGSEASQFCIVLDTQGKRKIEVFSRLIIPQMIFVDPMLTLTMPPDLTASSGIDALANCIEAYFSTWASPLTDALSLHAIRMISGSLRAAVGDGKNLEARQQMAMAAFEAGLAFTNAHAGAVHALGHPIAGLLNVPQRLGNAILLPHVMRHNMNAKMERMVDLAFAMGERVENLSRAEAAEKAVMAVQCLMLDIGLPTTLDKVGVMKESIAQLSQQALQDAFLKTNPCVLDRRDIENIYERAFEECSLSVHAASGHRHAVMNQ